MKAQKKYYGYLIMAALLCQTFSVHLFSRGTQYRIQILTGAKTNAERMFWNLSDISDNPVHAKPVVYPFSKFTIYIFLSTLEYIITR